MCHCSSTTHSKYRWRKNIRIREKSAYTAKLSGFKVPTLDSGFKISGDMTKPGCFHFGFLLVCKRQNQSGTKTFRIHHECGTISCSVNKFHRLCTSEIEASTSSPGTPPGIWIFGKILFKFRPHRAEKPTPGKITRVLF